MYSHGFYFQIKHWTNTPSPGKNKLKGTEIVTLGSISLGRCLDTAAYNSQGVMFLSQDFPRSTGDIESGGQ